MREPDLIIKNFGIIASISWNSNDWADHPTEEDLKKSKYEYVKENDRMHESLNFGHEILPSEKDGMYIGYSPMLNHPPDANNSKNVNILFFLSTDYHHSNRCIVGFYANPIIGMEHYREAEHELYKEYDSGNIAAHPDDIVYFKNPLIIDNENAASQRLLPSGKKISQMGFNYLNSDNVYNIISLALSKNPNNKKLKNFVQRFPLTVELTNEISGFSEYLGHVMKTDADSLNSIYTLEQKMKKTTPEVKQRISSFIERGTIARKVKQLNNYKCQICEAQGKTPYSFKKPDGTHYIEAHHVEPVSSKKKGVLSMANIITVCPNHHRQLHYGNAYLEKDNGESFSFSIEKQNLEIAKAKVQVNQTSN